MKNAIAITGLASISAAGEDAQTIWHSLTNSKRNLSTSEKLHAKAMPYPFLEAPCFHGNKRRNSAKDTLFLAQITVKKAIENAHISLDDLRNSSVGIVLGTTAGSALHFIESYAKAREAMQENKEIFVLSEEDRKNSQINYNDADEYFKSNLSLAIAETLNISGPCLTLANACTSGADAIGIGMELIRSQSCDYVICGGADALSLVPHTGFARLMVYDKEECKPFDASRKGLNLGEASAIFILESATHAKKRNADILGYAAGYGSASDAYHFTAPHPEAAGLHKAVNEALEDAGITKDELAFINAHATATKENDNVEGKFFSKHFNEIPVWGSKGITGHTLGAAGAIEALFSLYALQNEIVPLTNGFNEVDPNILLVPTKENISITKKYALSTSLGFGGGNAALIISIDSERYQ